MLATTNLERRQTPRTTIVGHAYVNIEPNNGGIVLNASDGGLCFHSFDPVPRNGAVHFWFSGRNQRIEGRGKLAWIDETHKGGLQFTELPAEAREQIQTWIKQSTIQLAEEGSAAASPLPREFPTRSGKRPDGKTVPDVQIKTEQHSSPLQPFDRTMPLSR